MRPNLPAGRQSRNTNRAPTLQTRAEGQKTIVGYAAVYYDPADPGTEYELYSDMCERIRPGAFDRALREDDVRALKNHDPNLILGRTGPGTLRLSVDSKGLRYEIDPPETQVGEDLVTELGRGDISGSSFSFLPTRTTWEEVRELDTGDSSYVRWIEEVQLFDVGPVTFPAYPSANSGLRSGGGDPDVRAEFEAWRAQDRARIDRDRASATALEIEMLEAGG